MPVLWRYCQPPVPFTPAVLFTVRTLLTGSSGIWPSAKMVPASAGNAAVPVVSEALAYWMAMAERWRPAGP